MSILAVLSVPSAIAIAICSLLYTIEVLHPRLRDRAGDRERAMSIRAIMVPAE